MVVVQLMGGVGNQMFQYACGMALALRNHSPLLLDISQFLSKAQAYKYELDNFHTKAEVFQSLDELKHIAQRYSVNKINIIKEPHYHFAPEIIALHDNVALAGGYWQSEKYFHNVSDSIRKQFVPKDDSLSPESLKMAEKIQSVDSVALHVRRGDYTNAVNLKVHGLISMDYYFGAINYLRSRFNDLRFFVFSDDLVWCREAFQNFANMSFVEHHVRINAHEDLWLMSQCKHNIIANSSYSWWGAWLNNNSDKRVIAPARWFVSTGHDTKDLIPEDWIKM